MSINQLFIKKIDLELLEKFLKIFNYDLYNINENRKFSKKELLNNNIIDKFNILENDLKSNYLNCKKKYFNNININSILTILRQHLSLINHKLISEIKYENNKKIYYYKIVNLKKKRENFTLNFD